MRNFCVGLFVMCMIFSLGCTANTNSISDKESCEKWVVDSYKKWMTRNYMDTVLPKQLFTPEMWQKLGRLNSVIDADAMLRAQDISDYGVESVTCNHLEGDWFQVSYFWNEGDLPVVIPVKIKEVDGDYKFCYITPYWGAWRGDSLFDVKPCGNVNQNNALDFVRSFYCNYTYLYAVMTPDLEHKLRDLQLKYCTSEMNHKIVETIDEMKGDIGGDCYDPVIMSCDFDIYWFDSLEVDTLSQDDYIVSYQFSNDYLVKLKVHVVQQSGKWMIDDVSAYKG